MKILHLIYDHINNPWVGGGGAVRVYEIYKRLAKKAHQITIISGKYPVAKDYEEDGIIFRFLGFKYNYMLSTFSYAFFSNRFLNQNIKDFDVIVEDFAPWNPIFAYRHQYRKPVVLQLHHMMGVKILKNYFLLGVPFFVFEKTYPRRFKNIISVSTETLKKFKVKGCVISNGINSVENLNNLKIGDYILYLGRIEFYNKGLDLLLNADLNMKTIIAGRGRDERLLKKLNSNFEFLGFVDEATKRTLIKNCRFLVIPSRYEGQGIVALEAAAMGKPVIVSDIPELKYVTEHGFGISFRSEDVGDLKAKIEYLWKEDSLILEMGKRGITFAKNHTWDEIAIRYEQYLKETMMKL